MTNTATRLITLIMLLQHQPGQKAAGLAAKLGVSVRSLHRYMAMLDEMGIPIYTERGPYGGFSLVRGYKLPPLVFTPEEAVAVALGTSLVGELWGQLYQAAAGGALAKLDNVLPDEQRQEVAWASRSLVATGLLRAGLEKQATYLEKLRRAVREQRRVRMVYQSSNRPDAQARESDPYGLVYRGGWWYMVGYCHLRQAMRLFRIDRIRELALTDEVFTQPPGFDVRYYLETEFQDQQQVRARMRFISQGAFIARDAYLAWDSLEEQPDGSIIVIFRSPDLNWAASTALSFGPLVEVLEPAELRQTIREWATAVAASYDPVD